MKTPGGTLNTYCSVKEIKLERLHTVVQSQLHDIWKRKIFRHSEKVSGCQEF